MTNHVDEKPVIEVKAFIEKLKEMYNLDEQAVSIAMCKIQNMVEERVNGKA